jgi:uncharacterized membrane protein
MGLPLTTHTQITYTICLYPSVALVLWDRHWNVSLDELFFHNGWMNFIWMYKSLSITN